MTETATRQDPVAADGVDVGETLSRARCSLGLSIDDVAAQLKFTTRLIDALEKGRYGELPGGTFARGIVRNYARLVKLDPEPLMRRLAASLPPDDATSRAVSFRKPIPFADTSRHVNLGYALLSLGVLAVVIAVVMGWPGERAGDDAKLTFIAAAQAPAGTPAPPAAVGETVAIAAAGPPLAAIAPLAATAAPAGTPISAESGQRITLRFDRASWVEVRGGDGRILTSQLNAAGTTRVVEGIPPFKLVIGNSQHVQLSYGERPIDLSRHARLDVARLTLE